MSLPTCLASLLLLASALTAQEAAPRATRTAREFDPVDPFWEQEWPYRLPRYFIMNGEDLADIPHDEAQLSVDGLEHGTETLEAVLQRSRWRKLWLRGLSPDTEPLPWEQLIRQEELRAIAFSGKVVLAPESLRQLRHLPSLESLAFDHTMLLDDATAAALLELPRLRHLTLLDVGVSPAALRALDGLPELDSLFLSQRFSSPGPRPELFAALRSLRGLRSLVLDLGCVLPLPVAEELGRMQQLEGLVLSNIVSGDDALALLPDGLTNLSLASLRGVTEAGLRAVGRRLKLRAFRVRDEELSEGFAELIASWPLARFDAWRMLDDRMLDGFARSGTLRRLSCAPRAEQLERALEQCVALPQLETFEALVERLPTPEQLAVLAEHPGLRRVLLRRDAARSDLPTEAELQALRTAAGCEVEVR